MNPRFTPSLFNKSFGKRELATAIREQPKQYQEHETDAVKFELCHELAKSGNTAQLSNNDLLDAYYEFRRREGVPEEEIRRWSRENYLKSMEDNDMREYMVARITGKTDLVFIDWEADFRGFRKDYEFSINKPKG